MDRFGRGLRSVLGAALLLALGTRSVRVDADESYQITDEVVLTDLCVAPLKRSDQVQIRFALENRSAERILFGGIAIDGARHSRIVASLGNGATTTLNTIPVAPDEVLSADGEVLWIEIDGLPSPPDGVINATVSFGTATIPISFTINHECRPSS